MPPRHRQSRQERIVTDIDMTTVAMWGIIIGLGIAIWMG